VTPMEEPLLFESEGLRLFGVLHLPEGQARDLGLLFCAPFAEEQKQACRVFVEMARRLATLGLPSLRFDYRGTGDSQGPFTEFSLAGALHDIQAAAAFLRERAGVERIGLIGLRLGASLAFQTADCRPPTADFPFCLVLWQPIVDGALFYRLNIRRMLVRQMMTHGKATGERDTGDAGTIDLDGFLASRSMCEEIKALRIAECGVRSAKLPPTLLVQCAPTTEPSAELKPLLDKLGPSARLLPFVLEPFWDRLGYVDCSAPIEATVAWLVEREAASGG